MDGVRILVLDRGWVVVGRCQEPTECGLWIKVRNGRVVRRWGTTRGLEEIANEGPRTGTQLDDAVAEQSIPVRAIVRVLECKEKPWTAHCPK
jgi:hypothetical protein